MKEFAVTDSFLNLDKETKGCQEETFNQCVTQKYIKNLIDQCQCLPFQIRFTDNVRILSNSTRLSVPRAQLCQAQLVTNGGLKLGRLQTTQKIIVHFKAF